MNIDREVNCVILVLNYQNLTLESMKLESKIVSTILTVKSNHNSAAE